MKNRSRRNKVFAVELSILLLAAAVLRAGAACNGAAIAARPRAHESISGQIRLIPIGPAVPRMFMGYSIEWGLIGRMLKPEHGRFSTITRSINELEQFTGPMLLRIGGDSETDALFELSKLRHPPKFVSINILPKTLKRMRELAGKTGCQYVVGLNLGVNRPSLAVRLVKAAEKYVGRRHIAAFEIGNEADLLGRLGHRTAWVHNNYQMYLRRWTRYYRAVAPFLGSGIKIEGPAFSGEDWFEHLPDYLRREHRRLGIISLHNYPMGAWIKNPQSPKFASIANLLGSRSISLFSNEMRRIVRLAAPYHLPIRFGEMNSVSGGGKEGVSNTFASTLWAAATLMGIAQAGGAGVNLHMSQGIEHFPGWYGPLRFGPGGHLRIMPEYYGMLAAADVIQRGGTPVQIHLNTPLNVSAFAFARTDRTLRVAIVNLTPSRNLIVHLNIPPDMQIARGYQIDAPSLRATKGVTITGFRVSGSVTGHMMHTRLPLKQASDFQNGLPSPASSIVIAVFHTSRPR